MALITVTAVAGFCTVTQGDGSTRGTVACPQPFLSRDLDGDGDVDMSDFGIVQACLGVPMAPDCDIVDFSGDGVAIDSNDVAMFLLCLSGTNVPADPECVGDDTPAPSGMVLIPAGEFQMGDTFNEGLSGERPVHAVWVDAFYMDRYEVTNQQYADALNWALCQGLIYVSSGIVRGWGNNLLYCDTTSSTSESRITWNGSTFGVVSGRANHPMTNVSWYGSAAYTNWRSAMEGRTPSYNLTTWECDFNANGYRLPTEAEWEKAARGGASGLRFPHGNTINHDHANYYANGSAYTYDTSPYTTWTYHPTFAVGNEPYTSPVGYFAPNGYGLYDMAGNVWEWCNDWYDGNYYSVSPYANPRGPASGTYRVLRGGSWGGLAILLRCARRVWIFPDSRSRSLGFRLALDSP